MPTTTITVGAAYPPGPGKKRGAVVDTAGQRYSVPEIMLGQFQRGMSYEVFYEDKEFQGHAYRDLQRVQVSKSPPVNMPVAGQVAQQAGAAFQRAQTNPEDAKRMWVCALLGHAIAAGQLQASSVIEVTNVGNALLEAHNLIFAPKSQKEAHPASAEEMGDEIPF